MKTILEHIDDLDRMIDGGNTPTDKLRSQLAFIGREVAALQADYASLYQTHAELHAGLDERISKLKERDKQAVRQWFDEQNKKMDAIRKSHTLE